MEEDKSKYNEYIETLKKPKELNRTDSSDNELSINSEEMPSMSINGPSNNEEPSMEGFQKDSNKTPLNEEEEEEINSYLPTPEELNLDLTDKKD